MKKVTKIKKKSADEVAGFLKKTKLFNGVSDRDLKKIIPQMELIRSDTESRIVKLGDISDKIYLITEGRAAVSLPMRFDMGEHVLAYLKAGESFGEMGVVTKEKRSSNIIAEAGSEILALDENTFWKIADSHPMINKNIIAILCERIIMRHDGPVAGGRSPLNLLNHQKEILENFRGIIKSYSANVFQEKIKNKAPDVPNIGPVKRFLMLASNRAMGLIGVFFSKPYLNSIEGLENIPKDKPVIFLLNYRTVFDFLFFLSVHRKIGGKRNVVFGLQLIPSLRSFYFVLKYLFASFLIAPLRRSDMDPMSGSEHVVNMLESLEKSKGRIIDVALHPTLIRSMRYDKKLEDEHFEIFLKTGAKRLVVPVTFSGTDKFWPFEPWERKFFRLRAFVQMKSVTAKIGKPLDLKKENYEGRYKKCGGKFEKIHKLNDSINNKIGKEMAALEGLEYKPDIEYEGHGTGVMRLYNKEWNKRLSKMLASGLEIRKSFGEVSIKIRHFIWHAEMLNVALEHLESEGFGLPPWVRGNLIKGTSHADMEYPYWSMDHSYNPYNKKGLRMFCIQFPDLMTSLQKIIAKMMKRIERGAPFEDVLVDVGKVYHYMADLAVPAHVHNIPHMFIDVPRIGKCDFEEFLGLDEQLYELSQYDIKDVSMIRVTSFDEFYDRLDYIARHTFLNSAYSMEDLEEVAKKRMITRYHDKKDLFHKFKRMGISVAPVQGYSEKELYYVRNLTTEQCKEISSRVVYFAVRHILPAFIFLLGEVTRRIGERKKGALKGG